MLDEDSNSDHKYISFSLGSYADTMLYKSTIKYRTCYAKWDAIREQYLDFKNDILINICDIDSQQKLNDFVCDLMTDIIQLCDKNIPKVKHNTCFKGNNWWTPELCQHRSCVNTARRRYQRCLTNERQQHLNE